MPAQVSHCLNRGLHLAGGDPRQSVGYKEGRGMGGDVGPVAEIGTQQPAQIGVDKAAFGASPPWPEMVMCLVSRSTLAMSRPTSSERRSPVPSIRLAINPVALSLASLAGGQLTQQAFAFRFVQGSRGGALSATDLNMGAGVMLHQPGPGKIVTKGGNGCLGSVDGYLCPGFAVPALPDRGGYEEPMNPVGGELRQVHVAR